jgi:hypothetical protein
MRCVHVHRVRFGRWLSGTLRWLGVPRVDPSFTILAMAASVEASERGATHRTR